MDFFTQPTAGRASGQSAEAVRLSQRDTSQTNHGLQKQAMPASPAMKSPGHVSKADYEALAKFRYALRQFLRFSEEAAQRAGVTPQQYQALLAIKGFPRRDSVTVGELAEQLQLRHHSAVGLINRLVAEKLASRQPSEKDRRQVLIRLTPRGEKVLGKLAFAHRKQLRHLGPELRSALTRLGSVRG
jgi:DNA-binding MarR family transcriptional regulator